MDPIFPEPGVIQTEWDLLLIVLFSVLSMSFLVVLCAAASVLVHVIMMDHEHND